MKKYILSSLIIATIYSCNNSNEVKEETTFPELGIVMETISDVSENCAEGSVFTCARINATYPVLKNDNERSNKVQLKPINESIYAIFAQSFIDFIPEEKLKLNTPFNQLKASFINKHKKDLQLYDEGIGYELYNKVSLPYISEQFVSIRQDQMTYAGGAHPDSEILFYTLDLKSGQRLDPYSWIEDTAAVKSLLLAALKRAVKMNPEADLEEQGFFVSDKELFLTRNILIEKDSISFAYNSYELAPYSFGNFDLKLPKSAIQFKHQ